LIDLQPGGKITTRGDANIDADDWGNAKVTVVGLYRARIPYLGYFFEAMRNLLKVNASGAWFMDRDNLELQGSCCFQKEITTPTTTATPLASTISLSSPTPLASDIAPTEMPTLETTTSEIVTNTAEPTTTELIPEPSLEPTAESATTQYPEPIISLPTNTPVP
jgi:hypothetical protein